MRIVEVTPAPCALCGTGNTPTDDGDPKRFVDLERDINWNDPLILCESCIMRIGGLVGMLGADTLNDFKRQLREKDQEMHDLNVRMDSMRRRARRLGISFTAEDKTTDTKTKVSATA